MFNSKLKKKKKSPLFGKDKNFFTVPVTLIRSFENKTNKSRQEQSNNFKKKKIVGGQVYQLPAPHSAAQSTCSR